MNIQYLIDNKSTIKSLNQKLINFKYKYINNNSFLETLLNGLIILAGLIMSLFGASSCAIFLIEENILAVIIIFIITLFVIYLYLNFIFFITEKIAIGKKYNKFQQALHEFIGEGISFLKKELIKSTINNLTKKEKNLLEEFIEKTNKQYKIKMQSKIKKVLIENKKLFHKYDRDDLIEVINLIDDNNLKSELINKVISTNKNKINKNNVILEI